MNNWDEEPQSIEGLIWETVNGDSNLIETGVIADRVLVRLWELLQDGESWAAQFVQGYLREGIRRRVYSTVRKKKGTLKFSNGEIIDMPTYMGITTKQEGRLVHQQQLWWEIPWDVLVEIVNGLLRQRSVLTRDINAFREILALRHLYPETRTAGEACELAGIDPRKFGLDDELIG